MPSIRVLLDDVILATICCDEYDSVSVRLHGAQVNENAAELDVAAGRYPESGESVYLTWVSQIAIAAKQVVAIWFVADGPTSPEGRTIQELFPGEDASEPPEPLSRERVFQEIRLMEKRRRGYELRYCSSKGTSYIGSATLDEHSFGFMVLWNSHQPDRASVSLISNTLESIERKIDGRAHVRERLDIGQSATIEVLAELS